MKAFIKNYLVLGKIRIALLSSLAAASGHILAVGQLTLSVLVPMGAMLCFAFACGALNQLQEIPIDARMNRTKTRPLPTGYLKPGEAVFFMAAFFLLGFSILALTASWTALALAIFGALWYNGFYTYFKRVSALAVIPGSLIGAIAPLIGWTCAGAPPTHPAIVSLAFFFFIWQIPHFWLLMMRYGQEYRQAGLPAITDYLSLEQLARVIFIWTVATAVTCLAMLRYLGEGMVISKVLMAGLSFWVVWTSVKLIRSGEGEKAIPCRAAFMNINIYALLVILVLSVGRVIEMDRLNLYFL